MPDDSEHGSTPHKKNRSFMMRIFGGRDKQTKQHETEEEILSLIDKGEEKGIIEKSTKSVIENIFDFDDLLVYEIMTHRRDITALEKNASMIEVIAKVIESGYSRIPVFYEDIDNIVGLLYVKDLLKFVGQNIPENFKLTDITREVMYVPRTKKCAQLFSEMAKQKIQLAIIIDEYGGTEGLITMEDLIEEVLGNIQDEYDNEEDNIRIIDDNKFTADGSTPIEEIEERLGIRLKPGDFDTIAGYMLEHLDHIPEENECPEIIVRDLKLTITKIEDRRIAEIKIEKLGDNKIL